MPPTQWTQVTDPEGVATRYTFSDVQDWTEENLLSQQIFAPGATSPSRTTAYAYQQGPAVGTIDGRPSFVYNGVSYPYTIVGFNYDRSSQAPQLISEVISEEGDTYTRTTPSTQFDSFGHPLQLVRSNSFGNSVTSTLTYLNDTANWVLGLPATTAVNGIVEEKMLYTALDEVQETDRFGLMQYSYGYDATGLLRTATDGLTHTTKFDSYFRGTPALITFADASAVNKGVNADGTIASIADELGYTTNYAYDSLSRLKTITYPSPDTVSWAPVNIAWQRVSTSPYGAASMLQTINDGHLSKSVYYDPLLQPIFEQESDLVTGVTRYRRRTYDSAGRLIFQSYPASAVTTTAGITTQYDALGRTSRTSDATGTLTSVSYLSGNRRSVTDGNGHSVTYTAQSYDEPGGDAITLISAPETQSTQIVRDVFGHVQSITQSGTYAGSAVSATRSYVYDAYYRPCKSIDPESGETALAFDAASNVIWKAVGQTNNATGCSLPSSTAYGTSYGYDSRNRLLSLAPPTGTESVGYTYYADGRIHTIVTPSSSWTYAYNGRRLLEQQTLVGGGRTFGITDAFDAQGHRSQRTSPSSRVIAYAPDAWGNSSRLGAYATGVSYFPSGSVAAFTYGNGVTYAQSLDARLRPGNVRIAGAVAGDMIDVTYGYDSVGNVLSIADAGARGDSRTLTYDGLNRLATGSTGILGSLTFAYDPLNNLRGQTATIGRSIAGTYNATTNRIDGITGAYSRSFGYNTAGDLTSDGLNTYTFDAQHRLIAVSGAVNVQYHYDGNYRRFESTNATGTTFTVYDRDGELVYDFVPSTGVGTDYLTLDGKAVAQVTAVGPTYLHPDPLGSPGAATNSAGNLLWYELYLPYGSKVDGVHEKIGFAGHVQDADTGLVNMQARYYSPIIGRFLSIDSAAVDPANPFTFNRYAYAKNNPQRFKDPDGRSPVDLVFLAVDIVELSGAVASGNGVGAAAASIGLDLVGVASPIPGTGEFIKAARAVNNIASMVMSAADKDGVGGRLKPVQEAEGPHSTYNRGPDGKIQKTAEYRPNPRNPSGHDEVKRMDTTGRPHYNKATGEDVPTPHVHDTSSPGGVRPAEPHEIPGNSKIMPERPPPPNALDKN